MSGPKTSRYTLTAEQRRILEERRKIRFEVEKLATLRNEMRDNVINVDKILQETAPLLQEAGKGLKELNLVVNMRNEGMRRVNSTGNLNENSALSELEEANRVLGDIVRETKQVLLEVRKEYQAIEKRFKEETASKISDGFEVSLEGLFQSSNEVKKDYVENIIGELSALGGLNVSKAQEERIAMALTKVEEISDPQFIKSYYAMTVRPLVKECQKTHEEFCTYGPEFEKLKNAYEYQARQLGIEVEPFVFSQEALRELRNRVCLLEKRIQENEEQQYIAQCVDEAMCELGYRVIGNRDVVRRNGKRYHNELYLFDEGTAVNVTYAEDGSISMELGGIDDVDRIPDATEANGLVSNMRTFCGDYNELEAILRKKGVVTRRISVLPPDSQYAQIINVSDYEMNESVEHYEHQKNNRVDVNRSVRRIGE